jgi:hypothetical protein
VKGILRVRRGMTTLWFRGHHGAWPWPLRDGMALTLTSAIDRAIADPSCDEKQSKSERARDAWQCGGD